MCGLAGILDFAGGVDLTMEATRMSQSLIHRGPDAFGIWSDTQAALAHRRLAIQELSPLGAQPMRSPSGRYQLAFNGELYNHLKVRLELAGRGVAFRGHADTETLAAALDAFGVGSGIAKFDGMYAIAVWDTQEKALYLARDRFGEKPLYYHLPEASNRVLFASELKALAASRYFTRRVSEPLIGLFLRYGYYPAPYTVYRDTYKLEPGVLLRITETVREQTLLYPSIASVFSDAPRFTGTFQDAVEETQRLLTEAVTSRFLADVPVGAFLSGGVDSTLVCALARKIAPIETFSIGFESAVFDESTHARKVAHHLNLPHNSQVMTGADAGWLVHRLPELYDEPFADSSALPTLFVSELARSKVTVALSGDGADELFGGYARYPLGLRLARISQWLPNRGMPTATRWASKVLPAFGRWGDKAAKGLDALDAGNPGEVYLKLISQWQHPEYAITDQDASGLRTTPPTMTLPGFLRDARLLDLQAYLPDDILVKVDRAAMAVSLEVRPPFLHPALLSLAASLPDDILFHRGDSKAVLKAVLASLVPTQLTARPKMGFGVPLDAWLRGPLKPWAAKLIADNLPEYYGWIKPGVTHQLWQKQLLGHNGSRQLWPLLMLADWSRRWLP